jgi:hypothetical protein
MPQAKYSGFLQRIISLRLGEHMDEAAIEPADLMKALLDKAKDIVSGSRNKAYGNPADNHGCTARMWTAYLSRKLGQPVAITARDVCFMNILQKCSREAHWSQMENALDVAGYAANAEAC